MATPSSSRCFVDLYKTLSVSPKATPDQIKSAFFKLAKSYHPDVSKSSDSESKFKLLNDAYQTLTKARKAYDTEYSLHYGNPCTFTGALHQSPFSTFSQTSSPFEDFANSSSSYQWGRAWSQEPRRERKPRKPEQQKSDDSKTAQPSKEQRRSGKGKNVDERFFWNEGVDVYFDGPCWEPNSYEEKVYNKYYNKKHHKRNEAYLVLERDDIDEDDCHSDADEYDLYEFVNQKRRFDQQRKKQKSGEYNDHDTQPRNRLRRKILKRIEEDPRPSDIHLLKKFGLDPRLFGLREDEDWKDGEYCSETENEKRQNGRDRGKSNLQKQSCDITEDVGDLGQGDWVYDFDEDSFKWGTKSRKLKKNKLKMRSDKMRDSSIDGSDGSGDETSSMNEKEINREEFQSGPKSVSIFTLASKRFLHDSSQHTNIQPLMDRSHRSHDNQILNQLFLNKQRVFEWLKSQGDHGRVYGLFENGNLVANYTYNNNGRKKGEWQKYQA